MSVQRAGLILLALLGLAAPALALDFASLGEPAVMYDAPSTKAKPLFVASRYTPVEVVVVVEGWVKLRDAAGPPLAWVERRYLSEQRTVAVKVARAQIHAQAEDGAAIVFEAEKDVAMELVEAAPPGWAKVKHRDGQAGYVRATQVWGL